MPPVLSLPFLLLAGFAAGFYGVNVGSSALLTIPALLFVGLPTPLVIATNRFAIVWAELAGVVGFRKHVQFDLPFSLCCGILGAVGAFVGSRLVLSLSEAVVNVTVAIFLLLISVFLLWQREWGKGGAELRFGRKVLVLALMPFIGLYAGFFGASYGTFIIMLLVGGGLGFFQSVATVRVIGSIVSVTAALSFLQAGAIQWPEGIALGLGLAAGGLVGVRFSVRRGIGFMRILLIVIAFASAAKLLWKVF